MRRRRGQNNEPQQPPEDQPSAQVLPGQHAGPDHSSAPQASSSAPLTGQPLVPPGQYQGGAAGQDVFDGRDSYSAPHSYPGQAQSYPGPQQTHQGGYSGPGPDMYPASPYPGQQHQSPHYEGQQFQGGQDQRQSYPRQPSYQDQPYPGPPQPHPSHNQGQGPYPGQDYPSGQYPRQDQAGPGNPQGYGYYGGYGQGQAASPQGGYQGAGTYPGADSYQGADSHPGPDAYQGTGSYPAPGAYQGPGSYQGTGGHQGSGGHQGTGAYQETGAYQGTGGHQETGDYQGLGAYPGQDQFPGQAGNGGPNGTANQPPWAGQSQPAQPAGGLADLGPAGQAGQTVQLGKPAAPDAPAEPGKRALTPLPAQPTGELPRGRRQRKRKRRRRTFVTVLVVVVLLIAGGAAAGGGYLLLRTKGSPRQTAAAFLAGWQAGKFTAMAKVSVHVPKGGLAGPITAADTQLGVRRVVLTLGNVVKQDGGATARFTVIDHLASSHVWTYQGMLRLVNLKRRWWVDWSPAVIYPGLKAGERFSLTSAWPARAQILDADGNVLSSPAVQAESGSISLMTGIVVKATKAVAKKLGAPYKAGDLIGLGGIEQAFQARLAGRPSLTIKMVGPGKKVDGTAVSFSSVKGRPVRTSLVLGIQLAASAAVSEAKTTKPVDMVVIQPSTGRILAMVERPGGFDRALDGIFPPGSTFKVVTASALARTGLTPESNVQCPATANIGGRVFHNDNNEHLGSTTLLNAFAISCNTTFALLATQRLDGSTLRSMARNFGFNTKPRLGIPATLGKFSLPHATVDLAADAFGQGTDLVNPLSQATVAAAIEDGTWRPPVLVTSPKLRQTARPHPIDPSILNTLRPMMRAVVTIGTASSVGFPPGVYGKTGTAEYGTGPHPKAHGWFIGYDGNVAFAVLVEGGGFGASSAGPIANAFLHKI